VGTRWFQFQLRQEARSPRDGAETAGDSGKVHGGGTGAAAAYNRQRGHQHHPG